MDEGQKDRLFGLCAQHYSSGRMIGFEKFVTDYDGPEEERRYLELIREVLRFRNGILSTTVFNLGVYKGVEGLVFDEVLLPYQYKLKQRLSERIPLSEFPWINTPPQQP